MLRKMLWILIGIVGLTIFPISSVQAAQTAPGIQSAYFSQSDQDSNDSNLIGSQAGNRPNAHRLAIPDNTPTPVEGMRWRKKKISIYMDTDDPKLQWAFKDAVKRWNRTKVIRLVWTKQMEKADVIANEGDLSGHTVGNHDVGYTTSELGSTKMEYNPDTNALQQATSTLDPNQLDYTSKIFRSRVAQHELGHALGLAHAPEYEHSVMIPRNVKTGITKNDVKTLRMLYAE